MIGRDFSVVRLGWVASDHIPDRANGFGYILTEQVIDKRQRLSNPAVQPAEVQLLAVSNPGLLFKIGTILG